MPDPIPAPDVPNNPAPPVDPAQLTGGGPAPQPAAPQKESFMQGFARGGAGESYVVDGNGNMVNSRTTAPSGKGLLGSILAGAVLGALHGATAARPGGIPSRELGGGAGAGAKAATDYLQQRDLLKREQAQQDFTRQQSVQKMSREQAESAAQVNHYNALTAQVLQHSKWEEDEHPIDVKLKEMGLEELATRLSASRLAQSNENLKMLENLSSMGLDPQVVLKEYTEASPYITHLASGQLMGVPNGERGEGHGAALFDVNNLKQPLTKDVTFNVYSLDPKTGELKITPQTIKRGQTTWDYVSGVMKANADLERIQSMQRVQAGTALTKAQTNEANAKAGLDEAQIKNLKDMGMTIPENFVANPNYLKMSSQDLANDLRGKGVTVPGNFDALYAVAHYKAPLSTLPTRPYNRPGEPVQMGQDTALSYVRRFLNQNYDTNNFEAVKELEKQFADTRPNTAGGDLLSFNRSVGHLGQLYEATQALKADGQTQSQTYNRIAQALSIEFGSTVAPNYNAIKNVLVNELGRTFSGKAPDVPELAKLDEQLKAAQTTDQIKGVATTYAHALLTKGGSDIDRYYAYTGELPPSTFSTSSMRVFDRMGINPSEVLPPGASVPAGGVGNVNAGAAQGGGGKAPEVPPTVEKALADQPIGWHQISDGSYWYKAANGQITVGSKADYDANKPR